MTTLASPLPTRSEARPRLRPELEAITPYQPGMSPRRAAERFGPNAYVKLSSNENPFGPSPRAVAAAMAALEHPETYPDSAAGDLKGALARHLGAPAERIAVGPGSEALIDYLFRAYLRPGDGLLLSRPTFPSYEIFARSAGAAIIDAARTPEFDLDPGAVARALRQRPRVMALCTPNNPTGNRTSRADLQCILDATPHSSLVLLDEAYAEFNDEAGALDLLERWGGVFLLTRTFSKAHGLAGLRVGYGVASGPEVVGAMDRLRPAFNLTAASQAAAIAALADQDHMRQTVAAITAERDRVERALTAAGAEYAPSRTNFIFARAAGPLEDGFERLLRAGVIVRPIRVGVSDWLRITIGRPEDNDRWLAQLAGRAD